MLRLRRWRGWLRGRRGGWCEFFISLFLFFCGGKSEGGLGFFRAGGVDVKRGGLDVGAMVG